MNDAQEEKNINEVIVEGRRIYTDYKKRMREDDQFKILSHQARFEYYMRMHIDFAREQPLILRHIASYGMFAPKAVRMYLQKCFRNPIKTDEDYCERQADYVKYLYMYSGKHHSTRVINDVWAKTKKHLMVEMELASVEKKKIKIRREKNKSINNIARRNNIKHFIESKQNINQ